MTVLFRGIFTDFRFVAGLVLGVTAGQRPNSWLDASTMGLAIMGVSMPIFWLGLMLLYIFSLWLGWVPSIGTGPAGRTVASALAEGGHDVVVGTRSPEATAAREDWQGVGVPLVALGAFLDDGREKVA